MASPIDVFEMKFDTICNRKTKKDFIDIYELCQYFSFDDDFMHFNNLYPYSKNPSIIFIAFGEIDNADSAKIPKLYKNYNWDEVKTKLKYYAKRYFLTS